MGVVVGVTVDAQAARLAAELREALDDPKRYEWGDGPWEHLGDAERDVRVLLDGILALSARLEAAETALRAVVHEFNMWSEDANDGTYAYYRSDGLMTACVRARAALAATDQDAEVRDLVYRLGHWHLSDDERGEYEARLKELRSFPVASTTLTPSERSLRKSWGPERMRHDPEPSP